MRQHLRLRRELYAVAVGFRTMLVSLVHTDSERNLIADALGDTSETAIPARNLSRSSADETRVVRNEFSGPLN